MYACVVLCVSVHMVHICGCALAFHRVRVCQLRFAFRDILFRCGGEGAVHKLLALTLRVRIAFLKYLRIHQQQFQLSGSAISDFMIYSFLLIRMMRDIRRRDAV